MKKTLMAAALLLLAAPILLAATPPDRVNYQGVLRDEFDHPREGSHDMIFRFFSGATGGSALLIDTHDAAHGNPVTVTGGLFNVELGSGVISGPNSSLSAVFGAYGDVWLEVSVNGELLTPRLKVSAAPFALNSTKLEGYAAASYLRSDATDSYSSGTLTFGGGTTLDVDGTLRMDGPVSKTGTGVVTNFNADLLDGLHSGSFAATAHTHSGSEISGTVGNADMVDGKHASAFIDTSSTAQTKSGPFVADASGTVSSIGVKGLGQEQGGWFADSNNSGTALVGNGDRGISALGQDAGGFFYDSNSTGMAWVGYGDRGIEAKGADGGAYFYETDTNAKSWLSRNDAGIEAWGDWTGGLFKDSNNDGTIAWVAHAGDGIEAHGNASGGYFVDADESGIAHVGVGHLGISAEGNDAGGYFKDRNNTGYAYVGRGLRGLEAYGTEMGGYFKDSDNTSWASVAYSGDGISAHGNTQGGYFQDDNSSGLAHVAYGDIGVHGEGNAAGAYFKDRNGSGEAWLAYTDGDGREKGIEARGNKVGALLYDADGSGEARIAYSDVDGNEYGVWAKVDDPNGDAAGWFGYYLGTGWSAFTMLDTDDGYGIKSYGQTGGFFNRIGSGNWADITDGVFKITGVGTVAFVQNHPYDPASVIRYFAPESGEVATYTRGTARLQAGEARVQLEETFRWVTNPDVGLTAYVTPREECAGLYVVSVNAEELVVRELGGGTSDAVFDYFVYGLRIGFEEVVSVEEKKREAYIPSMSDYRELYERRPDLRHFTALDRFTRMERDAGLVSAFSEGQGRATALRAAVGEYDPAVHGLDAEGTVRVRSERVRGVTGPVTIPASTERAGEGVPAPQAGSLPMDADGNVYARSFRPQAADLASLVGVSEAVEAGDVLVIDPERPGMMRRALIPGDTAVIGVVAAEPGVMLGARRPASADGGGESDPGASFDTSLDTAVDSEPALPTVEVPVAVSGIALCKVDAGYGAIVPGDLLTTSPTPGHAMRADDPRPGTILGKALEPLQGGTGLVRVLVTLR